jgi:uncharacterized protein
MQPFEIKGIALEETSKLPVVILHNDKKNILLPIQIGPFEASAIIVEMEGVQPPRPLTHDLIAELFQKHHFRLLSVEIYRCVEDKQLARIKYNSRFATHQMEVRPSDGIALAIRLNAPIYVTDEVIHTLANSTDPYYKSKLSKSEVLYLESQKPHVTLM